MDYFLGRYALVDPIGNGGMGSVWRAWDARQRRYVAAKLLRIADAGSILRFVREQSLRVEHSHVTAPTGWAAEDDRILLTMDLVSGGSVAHLLNDHGPLPLPYVAVLVDQLLSALTAVHAHGIVHRDVKPSNLLLEPTGRGEPFLRLADFGIAAVVGEPRLTHTQLLIGSRGYVAPECAPGIDPHPAQDLYSVGVVALQMLTAERPPSGLPMEGKPAKQDCPEGLPNRVCRVLESLLAASPSRRPASAHAALEAWREAVQSLNLPPIAADLPDAVEVFDQIGPLPEGFGPDGPLVVPDDTPALLEPAPSGDQPAIHPSRPPSAATAATVLLPRPAGHTAPPAGLTAPPVPLVSPANPLAQSPHPANPHPPASNGVRRDRAHRSRAFVLALTATALTALAGAVVLIASLMALHNQ